MTSTDHESTTGVRIAQILGVACVVFGLAGALYEGALAVSYIVEAKSSFPEAFARLIGLGKFIAFLVLAGSGISVYCRRPWGRVVCFVSAALIAGLIAPTAIVRVLDSLMRMAYTADGSFPQEQAVAAVVDPLLRVVDEICGRLPFLVTVLYLLRQSSVRAAFPSLDDWPYRTLDDQRARPLGITFFAVVNIVTGILDLCITFATTLTLSSYTTLLPVEQLWTLIGISIVVDLLQLASGIGLLTQRPSGRTLAIGFALAFLASMPLYQAAVPLMGWPLFWTTPDTPWSIYVLRASIEVSNAVLIRVYAGVLLFFLLLPEVRNYFTQTPQPAPE